MKTKPIIGIVSFSILVLCFSACISTVSNIGGSCSIFNPAAVKGTSVVCFFPVISMVEGQATPQDESISSQLWREIDSHKVFILVPLEDVLSTIRRFHSWDSTTACRIAQSLSADAFIFTRLNHYTVPQSGNHIVAIAMQLVDCKTDSVIAYAHYTSFISTGYHAPPEFDSLRRDAIKGVSEVLADAISKLRAK